MSANIKAVFIGYRLGESSPLVAGWQVLDDEGNLTDRTLYFNRKGKKTTLNNAWIGDVYELDETDGKWGVKGNRIRAWEDRDQRARWQMESRAAEASIELDKKLAKDDIGGLSMEDVREQYRKTIGATRRSALLAMIIQYVTK